MYAYAALAGLQIAGGFQMADIIRQNGDLQANVNDLNAQFADLDAHNALAAGYTNAARYQDVIDTTQGAERGAYASEGVSLGYGTAGQKEQDNRIAGAMNILQLQRSARDSAMGYQTQAINMRLGSQVTRLNAGMQAAQTQAAGITGAISTGISGYEHGISTGKGLTARTGTNDQTWNVADTTINSTPNGDGIAPPPTLYGNGYGWYPRGEGDNPGFFGTGPSPYYA